MTTLHYELDTKCQGNKAINGSLDRLIKSTKYFFWG